MLSIDRLSRRLPGNVNDVPATITPKFSCTRLGQRIVHVADRVVRRIFADRFVGSFHCVAAAECAIETYVSLARGRLGLQNASVHPYFVIHIYIHNSIHVYTYKPAKPLHHFNE